MLVVLYSVEKLQTAIRSRKIFAYLGTKITAILFRNKGKILCGFIPPWELRSFKYYFISDGLKAI